MVAHCTNNCVSVLTGYFAGTKPRRKRFRLLAKIITAVLLSMLGFGLVFAVAFTAYWKITTRIERASEMDPQPLDPAMYDILGTAANEADASLIIANLKTRDRYAIECSGTGAFCRSAGSSLPVRSSAQEELTQANILEDLT